MVDGMADPIDDPTAPIMPPAAPPTASADNSFQPVNPQLFGYIEKLLDRMDSTRATFRFELWVYNLSCAAALILVVFATARSVFEGHAGASELASYLTSGGLFAITGRRVTHFLDDNLQTIRQVLTSLLAQVQQSPGSKPLGGV